MNPRRPVPAGFTVEELFVPGVASGFPDRERLLSWRNFFLVGGPVPEAVGTVRIA